MKIVPPSQSTSITVSICNQSNVPYCYIYTICDLFYMPNFNFLKCTKSLQENVHSVEILPFVGKRVHVAIDF